MQDIFARSGISTLILRNYRLFKYQEFNLTTNQPVIIVGENGSGKTTILEALSLLNGGRGLRGANLNQMISSKFKLSEESLIAEGAEGIIPSLQARDNIHSVATDVYEDRMNRSFSVRVNLSDLDDVFDLSYKENGGIVLLHQKKKISSRKALKGIINTLWLTPQYCFQFVSNSQLRLNTIDRLISMSDYDHMACVSSLSRLLKDRIFYIKKEAYDNKFLDALENTIAKKISTVTVARMIFCDKLDGYMQQVTDPFPAGQIKISGEVCRFLHLYDALKTEELICQLLFNSRKEIKNSSNRHHMSLHKPQITLFDTRLNQEMAFLSTGQQQSLLFTFLYASICYFMHNLTGQTLLLLDDVFAHLDNKRRNAITNTFIQMPINLWMTGIEKALFSSVYGNCQTINLS